MILSPLPIQKFFDNDGTPLVKGRLFTYVAGTATKISTYRDSTGGALNTNPIELDYRGEASVWLDPLLTYKFVLAPPGSDDPPTRVIWTVDQISPLGGLTQQIIGTLLYPKSVQETAVSAAIVNYFYPYGCVDRYGTNTTPGVTSMLLAFNTAYQVAQQGGCGVTLGATAPYYLDGPVNCTSMRGITTRDYSSKKQAIGQPSVIIDHTGHGFDLSGSTNMSFYDMVPTNGAVLVPKTFFFMARNAAGSGADFHKFVNICTPVTAKASHIFYNYASEQSLDFGCEIYNAQPGGSCYNHNATNPSVYTSTFITIATGLQSNVRHDHISSDYFNLGNSGGSNEVSIAIERTQNFTFIGGMLYCPHGLAYISVGGTVGSNFLTVMAQRGETDGAAATLCGIAVRTSAATGANAHTHWTLINCAIETASGGYYLDSNTTSEFLDLSMRNCFASSGNQAKIFSAAYSIFEHGQQIVTGLAAGTVANCRFEGIRANVALAGTATANTYIDQQLAQVGVNGVRFPATQVSSSDANTLDDYEEGPFTPTIVLGVGTVTAYTTQTGSYTKVGRQVTANLFVQVNTVGGGPAGSLKIAGLPFTSTALLKGAVSIYVNTFGAVGTPLMGTVDASATTISIFVLAGGTLGNAGGNIGAGTQISITAIYETAT
jgi:hypothetical protein